MAKKERTKSSSTPGRSKGANCHKSQIKTQYCKDSRMYKKDPDNYAKICAIVDKLNK